MRIQCTTAVALGALAVTCFSSAMAVAGEDCPVELAMVSQWDEATSAYGDIWGDGDIAYVGQFGPVTAGVHFFDVSSPGDPVRFLEWQVGAPNQFASPQDVKVANGLLFISLEADPNDGVEIVDVSDPFNPQHLTWVRTPNFSTVHNTFFDNGYLYLANSFTPHVGVVDLTNFDPANPPARITENLYLLNVGTSFVHDMTAQNGLLYVAAWNSGLHVYDVSDNANQAPVFLGKSTPGEGNSTHAVWPTPDGRWAVVTEERPNGPMKLYEIRQVGQEVAVVLSDTVAMPSAEAFSVHNPVLVGTRVYASWYQAGALIFDIDEATGTLVERARFDTFDGPVVGFDGAWGVYPFLGGDRILVSDLSGGLFVLAEESLVSISFPEGRVTQVHPIDGATLTVALTSLCADPDPSTAVVVVEIGPGAGGEPIEIPLVPVGGDQYEADLPGAACGSAYSYYIRVDTLGGEPVVAPPGAPSNAFDAEILSSVEVVFDDDFEQDLGWTTSVDDCPSVGNETGAWERVDPNGVFIFPPGIDIVPGDDFSDDGTMCYVTGQGAPGGPFDAADVDGGPVRLISPVIPIDGQDAVIRYARWFVSASLQGAPGSPLLVEISGDDGETWTLAQQVDFDFTLAWVTSEFRVSDVMPPGATIALRFSTEDCPDSRITEALIDEVSVTVIACEDADTTPPSVVHDDGVSTRPFSGYVDPRRESDDGKTVNEGIDSVTIEFSEFVRNAGGADLDASAFSVVSTGNPAPAIAAIDASANPRIEVTLSDPIRPGSWYTFVADVEDTAGNSIENNGNQGPGVDESDRVDIAFLPADVDQSGGVTPFDLLQFRQLVNGVVPPPAGVVEDFADIDRSGSVQPFDLLAFRQLINGVSPATQPWSGAMLDAPRP